jgi:hypothetical protein
VIAMPYEQCTVEGCTLTVPHIHATSEVFNISNGYVVADPAKLLPDPDRDHDQVTDADWHRLEEQIRNGFTDAKD